MARTRGDVVTRAEAALALVAAGLCLAALVALGWHHLGAALLALAAVAVGAAGLWLALTRRGGTRVLAAAIAAGAFAAATLVLLRAGAFVELVALVAAAAVFQAATRATLRRRQASETEIGIAEEHAPRRAQPRRDLHAVLLLNPKSGGGKVGRFDLVEEARERGIETILLAPGDDLGALATEAAASAAVIGMAGGDGSQAIVAQVAMERGIDFVCIPAGTRNHLALDLGLDRDDVVGALDGFTSGLGRRIDLGLVNGRVFVNNVSLGVYAAIVQSDAYRDANAATVGELGPALLGPDAAPFDLRFRTPDGAEHVTASLVLVSNNAYVLDRLAGAGSRPRLDGGRLGILALELRNAADVAELATLDALGQARRFRGWREWTAETFEVDAADPVAAGIDGEADLVRPPLRFSVAASAVNVRLPPGASLSPAAASPPLSRSTLADLWQMAAGRSRGSE